MAWQLSSIDFLWNRISDRDWYAGAVLQSASRMHICVDRKAYDEAEGDVR